MVLGGKPQGRSSRRTFVSTAAVATAGAGVAGIGGFGAKSVAAHTDEVEQLKEVQEVADYQVAAVRIASWIWQHEDFREKLISNPIEMLQEVGIGNDSVRELIGEDFWLRESVLDRFDLGPVADCNVTCVCTDGCCVTCWAGTSARPGDFSLEDVFIGADDDQVRVNRSKAELINVLVERGHICSPA